MNAVYEFFEDIEWELSKEEKISNDDKITAKATYDTQELNSIGLKLSGDTISLTVSGLSDGLDVDPFEYLDISYEGAQPLLKLNLKTTALMKSIAK